jgi:TolB protein
MKRVLSLLALASVAATPMAAQEPNPGVRIGLTYQSGTRPGLYLLPIRVRHGDSLRAILTRDLDYGDRIAVIAPDSGAPPTGTLNYPMYAQLGAAAVLSVTETLAGALKVELHEVAAARVIQTKEYSILNPVNTHEWRMKVHQISDEIERWVTGVTGVASTQILFERSGTLWIVDSDGAYARALQGFGRAMSPAWHPRATSIAYAQMTDAGFQVHIRDFGATTSRRIGFGEGSNFSPTFSPDGKTLAFAAGVDGTDIWSVPLEGGEGPTRVSVSRGSESDSPSYSPDGRRITFASGRLGRPEVYISDADGADPQWLTTTGFGDQSYRSNPAWAPDGRHIAFQSQIEGRFQVATINLRDRSVKQHTTEGINEQPAWAPDGRHLVITSSRSGVKQLWVLDVESGRLRQLTHGAAARMGAWSPRLTAPK